MNKNNVIYVITNKLNGKRYVGQTTRGLKRRWKDHKYYSKKGKTYLYCSMRYYGVDNFEIKAILYCEKKHLDMFEIQLIKNMKTMDRRFGYNNESGGNKNKQLSDETKKKLSETQKGRIHSEETKKKMSETRKGENNPLFGRTHSEETKKKISDSLSGEKNPTWGKPKSEETKKKLSESHEKHSVIGTNIETGEQIFFQSIMDACRSGYGHVCCCLKGNRKHCKGYTWERVV